MTALNYFQLKALPGVYLLSVESNHSLLSASDNKFDPNVAEIDAVPVPMLSLDGVSLQIRATSRKEKVDQKTKHADINIFTIAGGHEYEKLVGIMIASVKKHNPRKLIKFWILNNYISPQFRALVPLLAEKFDIEIELVTYKWPNFCGSRVANKEKFGLTRYYFLMSFSPRS